MAITEGPHWDVGKMSKDTAEGGKSKNLKTEAQSLGKTKAGECGNE